ncbi:multidrug resistance protein 1 [Cutaneotrichosporon oleaginosum]|uniref:Multidrug resistance protein 1 n=1 Tax=Cutaneotrichosporon oleaginosum TaxID=879819 RepID=A0A0J0XV35_9TREE|nr:multidrug resistance protein 1 [Cutaneotrichosporon oleaginosum]KLT44927.1 multidrug resistance protein 1 [Cutaneotrichosporon oleaginosum]
MVPAVLNDSSSTSSSDEDEKAAAKKKRGLFKKKDKGAKKKKGEEDDDLKPVSIPQLFRFATPLELTLNFIGLFLACAAGATQPLMTLIFGRLTTAFNDFGRVARRIQEQGLTPENAAAMAQAKVTLKKEAGNNALYLMAIGLGLFLCTYVYMLIWNWTCERQNKRIREKYLHAVLRQEIAYFDQLGAGEVATRIMSDCNLVQTGIGEKIPIASSFIATFITGFALAYARQAKLAGAMTSILPVIMVTGAIMGIATTKYTTGSLKWVSKGGTLAEEIISSIRTVQAFGTMNVLGEKFNGFIAKSRAMGIKGSLIEGVGLCIMFFAIYSSYALAFFYGGILIANGEADGGLVINVFMSILIGSFSIAMLAPEMQAVGKAQSAAAKIWATIDRVPAIEPDDPAGLKPDTVIGEIGFDNVQFHYPSRPNVPILKGLTTTFQAGKTSALVGASGSGKSTVIQLIERFYDPINGRVTLDGVDIRQLNLKWFRQQIGFVQQEPVLFATTVRGNVEHGLIGSKWENAPDEVRFELVKKACINANADSFISKLPEGYDTIVGERGMLLSGGQKQRVAIARAIVSDPRILLLDEATSALDGLSERVVQDALDKASVGRTTIVIAHRLATIKDADTIIVMGGGEIIEQGTHNELLDSPNGAYALLVQNQKLSQKAADDAGDDVSDDEEEDVDEVTAGPDSPFQERTNFDPPTRKLSRQITGRSIASAALEQRRLDRENGEKAARKVPFMKLFFRLLKLNRDQWKLYALGLIGAICSGMVYPAMGILFGLAISDFELTDPRELRAALDNRALWYFIVAILAAMFIFIQIWGFSRSGWELASLLRTRLFRAVLRHDIEWFDEEENSTGGVTSNLSDQPQKVQGLMGVTLGSIIQSLATLIGGCIIGLCYGPLLALIGIACIPLVISSGYIRLRVVVLKEEKNKKWNAASAQLASEAAGAVRTVASLTREADVDRIYSEALKVPFQISNRTAIYSQLLYAASQGIAFLVIALVFYIGALWMIDGKYDTATFFTTLMATLFAAIQAGNVFMFVPDASSASSASRSVFRLLDNQAEIDADSKDGIMLDPEKVQGHLRLENIHFRYPSRPGVRVLRNLTIDVPPGSYVALVGPSGCGKSTSVQMIERFYDPQAGTVRFDGVDIRELNVASYRSHIALVSQEPTLYAGTIRFNILLGASKPMDQVTEEEIVKACKEANIYDFIMSLPDGFDTDVGGKGSQLSGGQKQRIAIARALVRNPKVLLLDEATAALDSTSERVVQQALDNASKGRSVVAIAHRLSTIQGASMIYFISEGKEVEIGTHAQLLARKGRYYDLVMMQSLSKIE